MSVGAAATVSLGCSGSEAVVVAPVAGLATRNDARVLHSGPVTGLATRNDAQVLHSGPVTGLATRNDVQVLHSGPVAGLATRNDAQVRHSGPVAGLATRNDAQVRHSGPVAGLATHNDAQVRHSGPVAGLAACNDAQVLHSGSPAGPIAPNAAQVPRPSQVVGRKESQVASGEAQSWSPGSVLSQVACGVQQVFRSTQTSSRSTFEPQVAEHPQPGNGSLTGQMTSEIGGAKLNIAPGTHKITVMIDGIPKEGIVDSEGRVQVVSKGPEYFSIASEETEQSALNSGAACSEQAPPLPVFGRESVKCKPNPFEPGAATPFSVTVDSGPAWTPPRPTGSPPKTRSPSPVTPRRKPALARLSGSPATPGGTKVPSGTPPPTPPSVDRVEQPENPRDYIPGERTIWELPRLGAPSESNPALRCNDWLHRIQPSIQDLAPKAHIWWALVLEEAKRSYRLWMVATPFERITIQGTPSDDLRSDKYVRLESRALAMLSKAVPASIYDHALSVRNTTCCGLVFFVLKAYQPGGLHERTELLKGLTVLGECTTAKQGVESLSVWARHLERARGMNVAIPYCTRLLDALDSISRSLLERHPALLFRMNSTRMSLQLDTIPTLASVEQYAKSLTAELEVIAVSGVDGGAASKKQKVASLATAGVPGKGSGKPAAGAPGQEALAKKGSGRAKIPCTGWASDAGCKYGKSCQFSHELDRPQRCWVCGGNHQKAECVAPGGGKGPTPEAKAKAKVQAVAPGTRDKQKLGSKGQAKSAVEKNVQGAGGGSDASVVIKEATQLLQSMRISSLRTHIKAATQLRDLGEGRRQRDLIDGGATACLRTARSGEYQLPTLSVELACGSCKLHINSAGALLSRQPVAPIVSAAALLELGYRIQWSKDSCQVSHPRRGQLEVDASSGCPEIGQEIALQLIAEYEEHVKSKDVHEARVRCLLKDLRRESTEQLARLMLAGGVEAALPCPALPCPALPCSGLCGSLA